jgi:hypothetical protein
MSPNGVCPKHGPYDGAACPYCSGDVKRPPAPIPLDDDDMPTDLGVHQPSRPASPGFLEEDEMPTNIGHPRSRGGGYVDDEAPTSIGPSKRGRRFLDPDDDEETSLGRGYQEGEDVTELYERDIPIGMMGILWVKEGPRRGKMYQIKDNTFVGRKQGDILLSDPKISSPHAKFMIEEGAFTIWDCGSTNGTFVNGEKIRAATTLAENDVIKIGEMVFILKVLKTD